jgi:hypothetical protein
MLVLYLFLSLLAFQIEQFEDSCNACTACKVCVPCQLCPDTCNKCYGAFANTTGETPRSLSLAFLAPHAWWLLCGGGASSPN